MKNKRVDGFPSTLLFFRVAQSYMASEAVVTTTSWPGTVSMS